MIPALLGVVAAAGAGGGGSGSFSGSTGFTNFSENLVPDVVPADWTSRMAAIDPGAGVELFRKVLKASAVGGRLFVVDTVSDGFSGSYKGVETWDIPGVIGTTWEVVMLLRSGTHAIGPAYSQADAPSGGLYTPPGQAGVQVTAMLTNAQLRSLKKDPGGTGFGAGALTNTALVFANRVRTYMRVRRDANRYRAKIWAVGSAEPGAYQYDSTEGLFSSVETGYLGFLVSNYTGQTSHVIAVEYLSVSNNPAVTPAPLPISDAVTGGNFGAVDFTTATVDATHFVHYPLTAASTVALSLVARGGSKQGTVLKVDCPAGSHRGFINWNPAGFCADGDVLSLIEVGGTLCGPGVGYPRPIQGAVYSLAQRSYSMIRHASDRIDWGRVKSKNTEDGWPIALNTGVNTGAINPGERWWVRQRKDGNTIRVRAWKEGTAEPAGWYIDSNAQLEFDVIGIPGLGFDTGGVATFYVEHLAWTDDPTANPINPV